MQYAVRQEIVEIVRRTRGNDDASEAALVELAKRDVLETLDALLRAADSGTPGSLRAVSYAELAELGRRLAASARSSRARKGSASDLARRSKRGLSTPVLKYVHV
jgi:hypothetical protein